LSLLSPNSKGRQVSAIRITSKDLALIAAYASLYAIMVYLFSPISFYALQFRIAGILRPGIARKWTLTIGYAMGVAIGNFFSPFFGPLELGFMPLMALLAGILGYLAAKPFKNGYFVAGAVIASIIAPSLSLMFYLMFNLSVLISLPYLFISEQAVSFIGAYGFKIIERRFKWWSY
jgi:uncharacterized membrane protein